MSNYVKNVHLAALKVDHLHHLGFDTQTNNFPAEFGDVKFICVGGTASRMKRLAHFLLKRLEVTLPVGMELRDMTGHSNRYSMFKVGPVLCVSHGMGTPSLSILLHELIKLVHYAGCRGVTFMRLGTCGGVGLDSGEVAISNGAVDGLFQPYYDLPILGKLVRRPINVNQDLVSELKGIADRHAGQFRTHVGTTLCALDFYEAQARLDGAFCHYTESEKMEFIRTCQKKGIVNIEMEAVTFFALLGEAGLDAAVVCVAIVNRLKEDQVDIAKEKSEEIQARPGIIAADFIRQRLGMD